MIRAVILIMLAVGYVWGLQALNNRAQLEMTHVQTLYTRAQADAAAINAPNQPGSFGLQTTGK
jgi:hypothetical protein